MKRFRLILMRHAQSVPLSPLMLDHKRHLDPQGIADAPSTAEKIKKSGFMPDYVFCSDAVRTQETWNLCEPTLGRGIPVLKTHALYRARLEDLLGLIETTPSSVHTVMMVAHNPTLEITGEWMLGNTVVMEPADALLLEIQADSWSSAAHQKGNWKQIAHLIP